MYVYKRMHTSLFHSKYLCTYVSVYSHLFYTHIEIGTLVKFYAGTKTRSCNINFHNVLTSGLKQWLKLL